MADTQVAPAVSVVIAAKNEGLHIKEALLSVLSQTDVDYEVVFVDDHSSDGTLTIAGDLSAHNSRLRVFSNSKSGKCSAFNYGISLASGRFLCIFAGDDVMPPGSLSARYRAISDLSDEKPVVGLSKLITMSVEKQYDGHIVPRAPGRGATSGVSPLMNRKAVDLIFPTPEHLPNEDTWMELAVLHLPDWTVVHSDIVCCQWRVHAGNSINHKVPFEIYNKKITIRMQALALFMEKNGSILKPDQKILLQAKIDLEQARKTGKWWSVFFAHAPLVDRLRALSITNSFMYTIRKRLYGLLSGW
jgi:glycosyltransferase involved in cell wall biosynthesis